MTLLGREISPPHASALAVVIADLFAQHRREGEHVTHTLERGLTLTAFSDGPQAYLALSRAGAEPGEDEAAVVAREAGWRHFTQAWRGESGTRRLLIRPAPPPPAAPEPAPLKLTAEEREQIRALLTGSGPHRHSCDWVRAGYAEAVNAKADAELLEDLGWVSRHWPEWLEATNPALVATVRKAQKPP